VAKAEVGRDDADVMRHPMLQKRKMSEQLEAA
jgi:hypothetical protein